MSRGGAIEGIGAGVHGIRVRVGWLDDSDRWTVDVERMEIQVIGTGPFLAPLCALAYRSLEAPTQGNG